MDYRLAAVVLGAFIVGAYIAIWAAWDWHQDRRMAALRAKADAEAHLVRAWLARTAICPTCEGCGRVERDAPAAPTDLVVGVERDAPSEHAVRGGGSRSRST